MDRIGQSPLYLAGIRREVCQPRHAQEPNTLDYDTKPYQAQYEWLGYHARKISKLLQECVDDESVTVDLFADDLDEPDILKMLESLGTRLRAFLDNAPLHIGKALEVQGP